MDTDPDTDIDWDCYFISEAYMAARKSKDRRKQVGAVIVGPDREIRAKGYNGLPRGFMDADPRFHQQPLKAELTCHAEENAIAHCARVGVSCRGCAMYVTFHPCCPCARLMAQGGITEVVLHREFPGSLSWAGTQDAARLVFEQCGIRVRWWSGTPLIREIRTSGAIHRF